MHPLAVAPIVADGVRRQALAEVRLEAVHTHIEKPPELMLVPFAGLWVGEVHEGHPGLPPIYLIDGTVTPLHEIPLGRPFGEERGELGDVRIDPNAHPDAFLLKTFDHLLRPGESPRIPGEITPVPLAHPVTVEMEDGKWYASGFHPGDQLLHRPLVAGRQEGSGQPEAQRPFGDPGRPSRQPGVFLQDLLWGRPVDEIEIELLARHGELDHVYFFGSDLVFHALARVDQ